MWKLIGESEDGRYWYYYNTTGEYGKREKGKKGNIEVLNFGLPEPITKRDIPQIFDCGPLRIPKGEVQKIKNS